MAERPQLKLKLSSKPIKQEPTETPTPVSAAPRIKLSLKAAQSPATPSPTSGGAKQATKSGRKPKATPKKRELDEVDSGDDSEPLAQRNVVGISKQKDKRQKLRAPSNQTLKISQKGSKPYRPPGVGYDSEDDEREDDPNIDNDFILRMPPGDDCDYLRRAISDNNFVHFREVNGQRVRVKGADIKLKFLTRECRRADVVVRGKHHAAILVDLPSIIEAMKSWNKKDFYKSADVHQMLLVLGSCKNEDEALKYPLPTQKGELDDKTWQWAHGITPPMRWARKRRFRKRLSVKVVEEDEQEVERLLQADDEAYSSRYRYLNEDMLDREGSGEDDEEDAEGELDDDTTYPATNTQNGGLPDVDEDDEDLEAHFEREMAKATEEREAADNTTTTPATATATGAAGANPLPSNIPFTESPTATPTSYATPNGAISASINNGPLTPAGAMSSEFPESDSEHIGTGASAAASPSFASSSSEDDEDDDDDNASGSGAAVDDDALERQQDLQRQREEVADLEAAIAREEQRLAATTNAILRQKIGRTILALRSDLEVKRGALGGGGGDDDGEGDGAGD